MRDTLVINMLAGPGAGKTACAWEVASELKKKGYVTEYVPEYPKELVWDGKTELLDGTFQNQSKVLEEQEHRISRLVGKVDFIVTDSPIILNPLYLTEGTEGERRAYTDDVFRRFSRYNNFCVFVERGQNFEQEGRIHNAAQSKELDRQITGLLEQYGIYYGKYTYERIHYIVPNCITTLKRVSAQRARERAEENRVDSTAQQEPVTADTATLEDFAALYASPPPRPKHMSADEIFEESSKYAGTNTPVQSGGGMCL